jgi:predicted nuclease of predicted toxin-antitoxin system
VKGTRIPVQQIVRMLTNGDTVEDLLAEYPSLDRADAGFWDVAIRDRRLLVTADKGFTEYRAASHSGILIVRLRQPNRLKIQQSVMLGIRVRGI